VIVQGTRPPLRNGMMRREEPGVGAYPAQIGAGQVHEAQRFHEFDLAQLAHVDLRPSDEREVERLAERLDEGASLAGASVEHAVLTSRIVKPVVTSLPEEERSVALPVHAKQGTRNRDERKIASSEIVRRTGVNSRPRTTPHRAPRRFARLR
jgi:hypothetical protein